MYQIQYVQSVRADLKGLRAYDRQQILDRIDEQLTYEPARASRNRKMLVGVRSSWEQEGIAWELRVGEYRVFYTVDEESLVVLVRAIRHKPPHKTTEEIL